MTTAPEILIIDDEVQIRRLLRLTLESAGYRVREVENATLGLGEIAGRQPQAVILDLGLPDMDGLEALRRIRGWSQLPVLILSVREEEAQKIAALDAGADDYLTKPFGSGELLARMRVLLRRHKPSDDQAIVVFGQVEVDFVHRRIRKRGVDVHLTAKEFALLQLLLRHRGKVITHRQLLRELWGEKTEEQTHYLRVHMTHLRQKLEDDPALPSFLKTEAGVGYRFAASD